MAKSSIKRFLEASAQFTEMSRERAEAIVKDMVKSGDVRAKDAERTIQALVERGRDASERIAAGVQSEVAKQMASMQARFDELEAKIESLTRSLRGGARTSTPPAPPAPPVQHTGPAKPAAPKKAAPRKATTKKTGAKKSGAKKASAKKASAKKTGAKKSVAKKSGGASKPAATSTADTGTAADSAVGTSGVRPIRTTRPD